MDEKDVEGELSVGERMGMMLLELVSSTSLGGWCVGDVAGAVFTGTWTAIVNTQVREEITISNMHGLSE